MQLTDRQKAMLDGQQGKAPQKAMELIVCYAWKPDPAMVKEGLEPDTLGFFEGDEYAYEFQPYEQPTRILLFLYNIWTFSGRSFDRFGEEVRTTYMHELGHYLGMDEEDLRDRGLE